MAGPVDTIRPPSHSWTLINGLQAHAYPKLNICKLPSSLLRVLLQNDQTDMRFSKLWSLCLLHVSINRNGHLGLSMGHPWSRGSLYNWLTCINYDIVMFVINNVDKKSYFKLGSLLALKDSWGFLQYESCSWIRYNNPFYGSWLAWSRLFAYHFFSLRALCWLEVASVVIIDHVIVAKKSGFWWDSSQLASYDWSLDWGYTWTSDVTKDLVYTTLVLPLINYNVLLHQFFECLPR